MLFSFYELWAKKLNGSFWSVAILRGECMSQSVFVRDICLSVRENCENQSAERGVYCRKRGWR